MAAIGGDILEITYNHPTVGNGSFFPKADEDATVEFGGFRTEDENGGITGSGDPIYKKNRKRWSCEVACRWDGNRANDMERYNALANSPEEATWTIEWVNGVIYTAVGMPVGEINGSTNEATFPLKIQGGGVLRKI